MSSQNTTVDDFDSVIQYSDPTAFNTPDPSNASDTAAASQYFQNTYHATTIPGASLSANFTGTSIALYGSKGPAFGAFEVNLNGITTSGSANASTNATAPFLLFSKSGLAGDQPHTVTLTHRGTAGQVMLFDYLETSVEIGAPGATIKNTTAEDNSDQLTYVGTWGNNTSPLFSGGTTHFTNSGGASVSLSFKGSTIYVWGDTNSNHGMYSVTLDDGTARIMKSVTGCGLPYTKTPKCERTTPGLVFYAAYLNDSMHTINITNIPGPNQTYFDVDRFTYSTPSQYLALNATSPSSPSSTTSRSTSSSSTPSNAARMSLQPSSIAGLPLGSLSLMFLIICLSWMRINRS